jgi:hypothetical protein
LVDLIRVVEIDINQAQRRGVPVVRSPEGAGLCRALWGHRNLFGTTWGVYCDPEVQGWIDDLRDRGELFPRMREELQTAVDAIEFEDRGP